MKRIRREKPLSWILWHPQQGLWNWELLKIIRVIIPISPLHKAIARAIVFVDTLILWARALTRRVSRAGLASLFAGPRVPKGTSVLYLDLGTHKEARELSFMVDRVLPGIGADFQAYGFEAGREYFEEAQARFLGRKNMRLVHVALCRDVPASGKVKLYKGEGEGAGSSLYKSRFADYEEVKALRLSDWIRQNHLDLANSVVLLRMNIEGAEYDVIADLVESGLAKDIDGYFGMWDDVAKIDWRRGEEFRALLAKNRFSPFTFNGRDLRFRSRLRCIEYEVGTVVYAGLRRMGRQ